MTSLSEIESRLVAACLELRPQYPAAFEGYYDRLLEQGRILTDADRVIVEYVRERFQDGMPVFELCAGIGQLSHALNAMGVLNVMAAETDSARYQTCGDLNAHLGNGVHQWWGGWQQRYLDLGVWICTNAVSQSNTPGDLRRLRQVLDIGGHLIWQPDLFGVNGVAALRGFCSYELGEAVVHQWK